MCIMVSNVIYQGGVLSCLLIVDSIHVLACFIFQSKNVFYNGKEHMKSLISFDFFFSNLEKKNHDIYLRPSDISLSCLPIWRPHQKRTKLVPSLMRVGSYCIRRKVPDEIIIVMATKLCH